MGKLHRLGRADVPLGIPQQLRAAGAAWQLHTYGGAPHAFTNPAQALNGKAGFGYDRAAAESSWHAAKGFLADLACGGIE